jgi:hypothetical protein
MQSEIESQNEGRKVIKRIRSRKFVKIGGGEGVREEKTEAVYLHAPGSL